MAFPTKEKRVKEGHLPGAFIWRRLHSLLGFWLVIYLFEHMLVNSQAALFFKDWGYGFVTAANHLESLPYLHVVELVFLGLPFFLHGIWGMWYAWTAKPNAHMTDGSTPALPYYKRNHAYSWERITAWLLIVGIVTHVVHMRFIAYPTSVEQGEKQSYLVRVKIDADLPLVVDKLHAKLYDQKALLEKKEALRAKEALLSKQEKTEGPEYYAKLEDQVLSEKSWLNAASRKPLKKGELLVAAPNPGGALYLVLRETFKKPPLVILYSLFVITAAYHAFNGVWTFMITWGITLTRLSQKRMRAITNILMGIVIFLGLMAAWGTCWPFHFQG